MSEQCEYERNGQYDMREVQSAAHDLRIDINCILADNEALRAELQDLKRQLGTLRSRFDLNEMVPV